MTYDKLFSLLNRRAVITLSDGSKIATVVDLPSYTNTRFPKELERFVANKLNDGLFRYSKNKVVKVHLCRN